MSWRVEEIARACGGEVRGDGNPALVGVSTDTRSIQPGQLFIALRGERYNGHDFLEEAVARGAAAALISQHGHAPLSVPTIRVDDTVRAMGALAAVRRQAFAGPVVAITGSNGKTTTKELCAQILAQAGLRVRRSPGNLNNHIGLPLSVLALEDTDQALVVELGMNHAGEIDALARIASPDVGAIIQVAPAHLGPLGSLEAIARAKGELFDHIRANGTAVINADDPHVCAQAHRFKGRHLYFGLTPNAEFQAELEAEDAPQSAFRLKTPAGSCRVRLRVPGRHVVENALCAAAAAWATGLLKGQALDAVRVGLESFEALPGRLCVVQASGGLTVLDDSYNANPGSMEAALHTLHALHTGGRAITVLGDMLELGPEAEQLHADVGELAARLGVEVVIGVGPLAAHAVRAAHAAGVENALEVPDTAAAAAEVRRLAVAGGTVLVKGSHSMHMERVVAALLEGT